MAKTKRLPYYHKDKRYIPMTKTTFVKRGSRWIPTNTETDVLSREQASWVLDKRGLPCERSHRLEKRDRFGHNEKYDTFSSISPDGKTKVQYQVDFARGREKYNKLARKSYYDKERYKRRKYGSNQGGGI